MIWKRDWKTMRFSSAAKEILAGMQDLRTSAMINTEIAKADRRWWLADVSPSAARAELSSVCRQFISVDTFVGLVYNICRFYGKHPRLHPMPHEPGASYEYWDRLKIVVEKNFETLDGLDVKTGIRLIRLYCPVGESQLEGLPRRLHFWRKAADRSPRKRGIRVSL